MTNNDMDLTGDATNFINYTTCFGPNGPVEKRALSAFSPSVAQVAVRAFIQ
jgi:hypothetical protein